MPAPTSVDEYIELVIRSGVVDETRVRAYVTKLRECDSLPAEPSQIAGLCVRDGILTYFQAEQILQGKWRRFHIGKYKVLERIGSGGMGQVFLCEHRSIGNRVAIKVLPANKADEQSALERFYREARAAATLDHPNLVRAYDVDQEDNLHFLVMDYVDGSSLQEIVKKFGPLSIPRACQYIHDAAVGLQHAFEKGLIHRDIKPANILIDRAGVVKILDMGLARFFNDEEDAITRKFEESILGTADYLAPEQAVDSHTADIRSDIYCLGGTFYCILTGSPPFGQGSVAEKLAWHQSREPDPISKFRSDVPENIQAIIRKMMSKKREDRFQLPQDVCVALKPYLTEPIEPPPAREMPALSLAAQYGNGSASLSGIMRAQRRNKESSSGSSDIMHSAVHGSAGGQTATKTPAPFPVNDSQARFNPILTGELPKHAPETAPLNFLDTKRTPKSTISELRPASVPFQGNDDAPENPFQDGPSTRRSKKNNKALLLALLLFVTAGAIASWYFLFHKNAPPTPIPGKEETPQPGKLTVSKIVKGVGFFPSLRLAIEKAKPGSTIVIVDPVWEESVTLVRPPDGLTIEAGSGRRTIWQGSHDSSLVSHISIANAKDLKLKNFTFRTREDATTNQAIIQIAGNCPGLEVEDCDFELEGGKGVRFQSARGIEAAPISISRCRFVAGRSAAEAIHLETPLGQPESAHLLIKSNRFEGNFSRVTQLNVSAPAMFFQENRFFRCGTVFDFCLEANRTLHLNLKNNTFAHCKTILNMRNPHFLTAKLPSPPLKVSVSNNLLHRVNQFFDTDNKKWNNPPAIDGFTGEDNFSDTPSAIPFLTFRITQVELSEDTSNDRKFLRYERNHELYKAGRNQTPIGTPPAEISIQGK